MALPSLLKPEPIKHRPLWFKIAVSSLVAAVVLGVLFWALFRFHSENAKIVQFMDEVSAGQFQAAYQLWHKGTGYGYQEFLQDWGTSGYYGPVHSYQIVSTQEPGDASGVVVVVNVSPFRPFPPDSDIAKQQRTKQVRLWVQFSDQSISYAP